MTEDALYEIRDLVIHKRSATMSFELVVPEMTIRRGEMVAVIGPSGCGKSSLLDVLAMAAPVASVGRFVFAPRDGLAFDVRQLLQRNALDRLAEVRRPHLGYVLQSGGLLPFLAVRDNINLLRKRSRSSIEALAAALGIGNQLGKKPADLSAGERQRVAIARALAHEPAVILADEPTAALDPNTSEVVMNLLVRQVEMLGASCIVATHDWDRVERLQLRRLRPCLADAGRAGWIRSVLEV
jgi:putative ABC transport system ATP-binding protein